MWDPVLRSIIFFCLVAMIHLVSQVKMSTAHAQARTRVFTYIHVSTIGYLELFCGLWVGLRSVSHVPLFIDDCTRQREPGSDVKRREERRIFKKAATGGSRENMANLMEYIVPTAVSLSAKIQPWVLWDHVSCVLSACWLLFRLLFKDPSVLSVVLPLSGWCDWERCERGQSAHVWFEDASS